MKLPTLLGRPVNSTLILFIGDPDLDFSLHCAGNPSLRARIDASGYEQRRTYASNSESIRELSRLSKDDASLVVLFLGAGASVVEGLPTGNGLRNKALAKQVQLPVVDESNFVEAASEFYGQLKTGDRLRAGEEAAGKAAFVANLTLERVLLEEQSQEHRLDCATLRGFADEHEAMGKALGEARDAGKFENDSLTKLLNLRRRLVVVTVNFDQVLEIKAKGVVESYVSESELARLPEDLRNYRKDGGPIPLIKLHGDIGQRESLVANIEETAGGLTAARLRALEELLNIVGEQPVHPWWFVGYSMRDLDLLAHWQSANFADVMVEHWVAPFVDRSVAKFIREFRQPRWDRQSYGYTLNNRVVTLTATDFYNLLWEQVSGRW